MANEKSGKCQEISREISRIREKLGNLGGKYDNYRDFHEKYAESGEKV